MELLPRFCHHAYLTKADEQELLVCHIEAWQQCLWTMILDPILVALFGRYK